MERSYFLLVGSLFLFLFSLPVKGEESLNQLTPNDPKACIQRDATRFRVEFPDIGVWPPRIGAGNIGDSFPRSGDGWVRSCPNSDIFSYNNVFDFQNELYKEVLEKILRFPKDKMIPIWTVGYRVVPDAECSKTPLTISPKSEFTVKERFILKNAHVFKHYEARAFHIDVWVSDDGEPMAQFSGDWRRNRKRMFSRFGLKPHDSLGTQKNIPDLNGFELTGENLDVFYNFVLSYRDHLEKLSRGQKSKFLVCGSPYSKTLQTYLFYPQNYCSPEMEEN